MSDLIFRQYQPADENSVLEVYDQAICSAHYFLNEEQRRDERKLCIGDLRTNQSGILIFELNGEIVGFASISGIYLKALFISPQHQKKGLGSQAMEHLQKHNPRLELPVYKANTRACSFYKKHKFKIKKSGKNQNGHKFFTMRWEK